MRMFFALLSLFYVAAIFILAGFPIVRELSKFNPYSLLHIPLFGILTSLLVFSMVSPSRGFKVGSIQLGNNPARSGTGVATGLTVRLFVAGAIALLVGIFDEIHQLYVPGRDASISDVMLDTLGIILALLLCSRLLKTRFLN